MKKPLTLWTYPGNTEGGEHPDEANEFEKDIYGVFTLTPHRFEKTKHHGHEVSAPITTSPTSHFCDESRQGGAPRSAIIVVWVDVGLGQKRKPV